MNLGLKLNEPNEEVTVHAATPQIHYDHHQVGGVVSRDQIENLPLNGRNFLELARLEPGVTNPVRRAGNRILISVLGAGVNPSSTRPLGNTRVSVDGANVVTVGSLGVAMSVSQEVVQEFQVSTLNFDLATGITGNGAINIVTRSGGNELHGSGFYFFRDHNLAAYPGLSRDATNPAPFFQRRQFGFQVGGPIRRDRAFFFANYERTDQRGVYSVQPSTPAFAPLGGVFASPYRGNQFTTRFDFRLHPNHNAFVRYTHDDNRSFAPQNAAGMTTPLPSGWSRATNFADQGLGALTSALSSNLANDIRFSYFLLSGASRPGSVEDCSGCLGLGAANISIPDAGVVLGNPMASSFLPRRYELTEGITWQRASHRLRFGVDWEHATTVFSAVSAEPANLVLFSPREVGQFNAGQPAEAQIPLPASFLTVDDILRLPLQRFSTGIGPGITPQPGFLKYRVWRLYRLYAADTWRLSPRLTLNYGLSWSYEPGHLNHDLTKPALLTPILGPGGLNPPVDRANNVAPTFGFAWSATRDGKTVVRGGAGHYYDPVVSNTSALDNERRSLLPRGSTRVSIPGSSVFYNGSPD